MKKILSLFIAILIAFWVNITFAQEIDEAVNLMYEKWITKYVAVPEYNPDALLTREQAAKMMVQFSTNVLGKTTETNQICNFSDLNQADPEFQDYITKSCRLWIFKWKFVNWIQIFDPRADISKAEFITVVVRSIKWMLDENISPWWINYFKEAKDAGIITNTEIKTNITRHDVALIFYRTANLYLTIGSSTTEEVCGGMWYNKALEIAKDACGSEWGFKSTYMCNDYTSTWWFDMDIEKEGCNPACVVDTKTWTAEINWRCTGLITDTEDTEEEEDETSDEDEDLNLEDLLNEMIE